MRDQLRKFPSTVLSLAESPMDSNRAFGTVFLIILILVAVYGKWNNLVWYRWPAIGAVILLIVILVRPTILIPINRTWMRFGNVMHRLTNPILIGVIFFGIFAPLGILMRLAGRDILKRRYNEKVPTYWIKRIPPGPPADDLKNQF